MPFLTAKQLVQEKQRQQSGATATSAAFVVPAAPAARTAPARGRGGRGAGRGRQSLLSFAPSTSAKGGATPSPVVEIVDVDKTPEGASSASASSSFELRSLLVGRQFHRPGNQQLLERAQAVTSTGSEGARLDLLVEREPTNRYDACALLVRCEADGGPEPCGHLPKEFAAVVSPLLDQHQVAVSSVTVDAHQVVEFSTGEQLRALPVLVRMELRDVSSSQEMAHVRAKLQHLAVNVATIARPTKRRVEQPKSQAQSPAQRSLLSNFGRGGVMAEMPSGAGVLGARVLASPSFVPELAKQVGITTLLAIRRVCQELRCSVDALQHTRCRQAVERLIASPLGDAAASESALAAVERASPASAGALRDGKVAFNLAGVVQAVAEWSPSDLTLDAVKQALSAAGTGPPWALLECYAGCSFCAGWPALAAAVWAAASADRMRLIKAAMACVPLEELREVIAFIVLLSDRHLQLRLQEPGNADSSSGRAVRTMGLRRLHRDLLAANRLLEEAGLKVSVVGLRMPSVCLTEEQSQIVVKTLAPTELLLVSAFAGTGKTSTLRMYALLRPHLRILYLCFNVSVREEAQRCFPSNVTCKSVHQLAYAACGYRFRQKLAGDQLRAEDMANLSLFDTLVAAERQRRRPAGEVDAALQRLESVEACLATLKGFLNSADTSLSEKHLPHPLPGPLLDGSISREAVCNIAKELWRRMCDPTDSEVKTTHGGYLKIYSLSRPELKYDLVMLDEAQDCNPAIASVVTSQSCARILVGDEHQAIYGFLGAQDMLKEQRLKSQGRPGGVIRRQLTRSFRFGHNVADVANFLLRSFTMEARPLLGCGAHAGQLLPQSDLADVQSWPSPPFAFVARTNTSVLTQALRADEAGLSLEWVGGVKGYKLGLLRDLCFLALGQRDRVESGRIKAFPSLAAVQSFARRIEDRELAQRTDLVSRSNPDDLLRRLQRLEALAERREKATGAPKANVSLSTVHKAKGLEWDTVVVADDFLDTEEEAARLAMHGGSQISGDVQELNMLYVALTRCKRGLQLPASLARLYLPEAEAVSLAEPEPGGRCVTCGDPLQAPAQAAARFQSQKTTTVRPVGSVSLQALCSACSRSTCLG